MPSVIELIPPLLIQVIKQGRHILHTAREAAWMVWAKAPDKDDQVNGLSNQITGRVSITFGQQRLQTR